MALDEEYPNALPENLTVPLIMESWETQSGYPVINAIRDYSTYKVTLSQVINSSYYCTICCATFILVCQENAIQSIDRFRHKKKLCTFNRLPLKASTYIPLEIVDL